MAALANRTDLRLPGRMNLPGSHGEDESTHLTIGTDFRTARRVGRVGSTPPSLARGGASRR